MKKSKLIILDSHQELLKSIRSRQSVIDNIQKQIRNDEKQLILEIKTQINNQLPYESKKLQKFLSLPAHETRRGNPEEVLLSKENVISYILGNSFQIEFGEVVRMPGMSFYLKIKDLKEKGFPTIENSLNNFFRKTFISSDIPLSLKYRGGISSGYINVDFFWK